MAFSLSQVIPWTAYHMASNVHVYTYLLLYWVGITREQTWTSRTAVSRIENGMFAFWCLACDQRAHFLSISTDTTTTMIWPFFSLHASHTIWIHCAEENKDTSSRTRVGWCGRGRAAATTSTTAFCLIWAAIAIPIQTIIIMVLILIMIIIVMRAVVAVVAVSSVVVLELVVLTITLVEILFTTATTTTWISQEIPLIHFHWRGIRRGWWWLIVILSWTRWGWYGWWWWDLFTLVFLLVSLPIVPITWPGRRFWGKWDKIVISGINSGCCFSSALTNRATESINLESSCTRALTS